MHRALLGLLGLLIACSHPAPTPIPVPVPAPAPIDAAPPPPLDAPPPPPPPIDASTEFRAYTPPVALTLDPPDKPATACLANPEQRETAREVAALDLELRKHGGMVLHPSVEGRGAGVLGAIARGPMGQRLMVVGALECGRPMPLVAIDAKGEVFEPEIAIKARATRSALSCTLPCGGCGVHMPPYAVVVEVPDGAHLGPPRTVDVPLDVKLTFTYPKTARCLPRP